MADESKTPTGTVKKTPAHVPLIRWQKTMLVVLIATIPATLGAVYRFGWRCLLVMAVVSAVAFLCEWLFTRTRKEPVTSAVFVTSVLLTLTLPPTIPLWMAAVGALIAIVFSKELFGGFGRNIFNPALVGRCFLYICFPVAMTGRWAETSGAFPGGFAAWNTKALDAVTAATPLDKFDAQGILTPYADLLFGNRLGCMGETIGVAILLGAILLLATRTADYRIMLSCLLGALGMGAIFKYTGGAPFPDPLWTVLAGGFLFGAVFMVTDPVSASRTLIGKWVYGAGAGILTVVMRRFGNFPEGIMFAILLMNMFVPALDIGLRAATEKKPAPQPAEAKP